MVGNWHENWSISRETCLNATLCNRNPTWPTLWLNPGFRGKISVTTWYRLLGSLWRKGEYISVAIDVEGSLCTILGCCKIPCAIFTTTQRIIEFSAEEMLFSTLSSARPISRPCHVTLTHITRIALSHYHCMNKWKIYGHTPRNWLCEYRMKNGGNKTWHCR